MEGKKCILKMRDEERRGEKGGKERTRKNIQGKKR